MARWFVAVALAAAAFAFAGLAVAASSFPDAVGDNNEAPDLRSVTLSEETAGTISIAVAVGNYESLPADSWINVWFDLDSNPSTGYDGDEALIQYSSNGGLAFYRWDGSVLLSRAATGMTSSFASGVLTVTAPKEALDSATAFGILAIASRSQLVAGLKFIASDSAPDRGRSAYAGPAQMEFTDLADDHDSAPDITSAQVTDAKNGWISIALSTPNYAKLPPTRCSCSASTATTVRVRATLLARMC